MAKIKGLTVDDIGSINLPRGTDSNRPSNTVTVDTFSSVGTTSWTAPTGVNAIDVLIVGGGGSGGRPYGGGGGGGGVIYKTNYPVVPGTSYLVTVGAGGAGLAASLSTCVRGNDGGNSAFDNLVAIGGGGGGCWGAEGTTGGDIPTVGKDGGSSGGGGARNNDSDVIYDGQQPGTPTLGQGHAGGTGLHYLWGGSGGGGGAGEPGQTSYYKLTGGRGGNGILCSITGTPVYYGGGGGGGAGQNANTFEPAPGGLGGGGAAAYPVGGTIQANGVAGTNGLGGGGGGAAGTSQGSNANTAGSSGAGGSGVVIIRYSLDVDDETNEAQVRFNTETGNFEKFVNEWQRNSNDNQIVSDGLRLHIDGENYGGSGAVRDLSKYAHTGTISGATYNNNGYWTFDGNDLILFDDSDLDITGAFTSEAWIKSSQLTGNSYSSIISWGRHTTNQDRTLWLNGAGEPGGSLGLYFYGTTSNMVSGETILTDDRWHHVVGTFDGRVGKVYVDGKLEGVRRLTAGSYTYDGTRIGANPSPSYYFNGAIAVARIYARALSHVEILKNFDSQRYRFETTSVHKIGYASNIIQDRLLCDLDSSDPSSFTMSEHPKWKSRTGSYHGIIEGQPYFDGNSFKMTGSEYVRIPYSGWSANGDKSFGIWIMFDSITTTQWGIFNTGSTGDIDHSGDGRIRFHAAPSNYFDTQTGVLAANTWYYIVGTQTYNKRRIFVNGKEFQLGYSGTPSGGSPDTAAFTDGDILLGHEGSYRNRLQGRIGAFHLYDKKLSEAEIAHNYHAMKRSFGNGNY